MELLIYMLGPGLLVTSIHTLFHFISKLKKIIPNLAALERLEHSGHCFARIYTLHSISQIWKGIKIAFRIYYTVIVVILFSASGCSLGFSRGHRWRRCVWHLHGQEAQGDGSQVSEIFTSDLSDHCCQDSPSWRRAPPWEAPGMTTSTLAAPVTCQVTSTGITCHEVTKCHNITSQLLLLPESKLVSELQ